MPEEPIQKEPPIDITNIELKTKPTQDIENKGKEFGGLPTTTNEKGEVVIDNRALISIQIKVGLKEGIEPQVILYDVAHANILTQKEGLKRFKQKSENKVIQFPQSETQPTNASQGEKVIQFPKVAQQEQARQAA